MRETRLLRRLIVPMIGWALSLSLARSLAVALDGWGVLACVAGVHAAYAFDALADRVGLRDAWRDRGMFVVVADGVLLAAAALSSPRLIPPLMVLSLAGLLYIPLKRWIPKNLLTAVAWTAAVFGLSLEGLALDARTGFAIAALLLTIASNANLCDLPDVERDREARVRGFGPWLGVHATARIAGSFGLLGALCAVAAGAWALCVPAILYGVLGWVFAERLAEERSLRVWIDAALILPGPISLLF